MKGVLPPPYNLSSDVPSDSGVGSDVPPNGDVPSNVLQMVMYQQD